MPKNLPMDGYERYCQWLEFERQMLKHYEEDGWQYFDHDPTTTESMITDTKENIERLEKSIELYEKYLFERPH